MMACTVYQYYSGVPLNLSGVRHIQGTQVSQSDNASYERHVVRPDGLLEVNMAGRHPLWDLLGDAERQWDELNSR